MKVYGTNLKSSLEKNRREYQNLENKIEKRYNLVIDKYSKYFTNEVKNLISHLGRRDMTIDKKIDIIIRVEEEYVRMNSNQLNMFSDEQN